MPSLSIDCRSLLQVINCNANKNSEISPHPTIVKVACVASVSNRVIALKLERILDEPREETPATQAIVNDIPLYSHNFYR